MLMASDALFLEKAHVTRLLVVAGLTIGGSTAIKQLIDHKGYTADLRGNKGTKSDATVQMQFRASEELEQMILHSSQAWGVTKGAVMRAAIEWSFSHKEKVNLASWLPNDDTNSDKG